MADLSSITDSIEKVHEAMSNAYLERACPDGGIKTSDITAYIELRGMIIAEIQEWHEQMLDGSEIYYDADYGCFNITCMENEDD